MEIYTTNSGNKSIAIVTSNEIILSDVQSAIDFMMTVQHETDCSRIVIVNYKIGRGNPPKIYKL